MKHRCSFHLNQSTVSFSTRLRFRHLGRLLSDLVLTGRACFCLWNNVLFVALTYKNYIKVFVLNDVNQSNIYLPTCMLNARWHYLSVWVQHGHTIELVYVCDPVTSHNITIQTLTRPFNACQRPSLISLIPVQLSPKCFQTIVSSVPLKTNRSFCLQQ